ncbi:MAG: DNA-directed RNA polymerase subunit beta [Firmicutes bacterium]|nr:DNA-directed RNA polymerase subunit beta [Bacillota bacterium]MDY5041700.1 DNA-directed RNA polymerase subunit beta [Eubacteriales bacterium]
MLNTENIKKIKYGNTTRYTFGHAREIIDLPYLLEIQKDSYNRFIKEGIGEALEEFSPITDYSGKAEVYLLDYTLEPEPKITIAEAKRKSTSYSVALKVKVRLVIKETGEVIEQEVFLGDVPYMTNEATFIFNGIERVVVSQLVRSPSAYYSRTIDKTGKELYNCTLIPTRGSWLEMEQKEKDPNYIRVCLDKGGKIGLGVFLKCFGFTRDQILDIYGNNEIMRATLDKDAVETQHDALIELSKKTRPSEIPSAEATKQFIFSQFFSTQYYNLGKVGRFKVDKKLDLATRSLGLVAAEDIKTKKEVLVKAGETITKEVASTFARNGINEIVVMADGKPHKMVGNNRVRVSEIVKCNEAELGITEKVHYPTLMELIKDLKTREEKVEAIKEHAKDLVGTTLFMDDILGCVSYFLDLNAGIGEIDVVDHLCNRRIKGAGELLQDSFRSGMNKLVNAVKETLQSHDLTDITPSQVVNARPINRAFKDFLASHQLSQLMDEMNPLSSLAQKRRLSAVGPGGIKKDRATDEVRDIHHSHYGRICVVETPEGGNIGLINSLATYARVNEYGFIETPYRVVDKEKGIVTNEVVYLMADEDENCYIAQAIEPLNPDGSFVNNHIACRHLDTIVEVSKDMVDYVDVSPKQLISVPTACIPFLENDDTPRALMGSNMQRQAVPLITTETAMIGTGLEHKIALDNGAIIVAKNAGTVTSSDATHIEVTTDDGFVDKYDLIKFTKTNQESCNNQKPIVKTGQKVKKGETLADGYSTKNGELALGKNMLIAFMNWEGYNYEDAILLSERLVKEDVYTSINLKEAEVKCRSTKLGDEEITRDIPNLGEEALKDLDENGIIRIGAEVKPGDILVGKVTPKGETEPTPEERLLRAIFGEKARDVKDTSLRVSHGISGVVVDVQVFSRKNKDDLETGVNMMVRVTIAQKRKISVGDKMAGRHGNKGIVSRILPVEDMPFMANGQPIDIVLNPLGIPSRMNVGQVLEVHLGLVAKALGINIATPAFDGVKESDIRELLKENNFPENGKIQLYDGRTGEPFENPVTVGYMYYIKLEHMVNDKMHARSTGPYAYVTQQPLGGKAMFGGQRFGEMEVWALEAYGASKLLQEMLTVKSDDVEGRYNTYKAIVEGLPLPEPSVPEAFKVLIKELQGLCLDVRLLTDQNKEFKLSDLNADSTESFSEVTKPREEQKEIELEFDETNNENNENADLDTDEDLDSLFDESALFDDFGDDDDEE